MSESIALTEFEQWPVFGLKQSEKQTRLGSELRDLTQWHLSACANYQVISEKLFFNQQSTELTDIPFLPVRLFKLEKLVSVPDYDIVKTMTSSGTSGQHVSQIYLDKQTASRQIKILSKIVTNFIGPKRLPMLVIDAQSTVSNRLKFSARTTGILGFSMFGRDVTYALDDDMSINIPRVSEFLEKHAGQEILLFGFTFMVWQHLVLALEKLQIKLPIHRGYLIHGGGWKQLQNQAVDALEFKNRLKNLCGDIHVYNYYGMVEQTGSIFMECDHGHLHASSWSEIIIRDPVNFKPNPPNKPGLIQLLSVIPHSYPGHSLLSEDWGELLGVDDCPCGRYGSYFKVHGRIQNAEVRGCSDTYAS